MWSYVHYVLYLYPLCLRITSHERALERTHNFVLFAYESAKFCCSHFFEYYKISILNSTLFSLFEYYKKRNLPVFISGPWCLFDVFDFEDCKIIELLSGSFPLGFFSGFLSFFVCWFLFFTIFKGFVLYSIGVKFVDNQKLWDNHNI